MRYTVTVHGRSPALFQGQSVTLRQLCADPPPEVLYHTTCSVNRVGRLIKQYTLFHLVGNASMHPWMIWWVAPANPSILTPQKRIWERIANEKQAADLLVMKWWQKHYISQSPAVSATCLAPHSSINRAINQSRAPQDQRGPYLITHKTFMDPINCCLQYFVENCKMQASILCFRG